MASESTQTKDTDEKSIQMQVLGELICDLNPYAEKSSTLQAPKDQVWTGKMDIFMAPAPNSDPVMNPNPPNPGNTNVKYRGQVEIEMDTQYPGDWNFKKQAHRINTAIRIKYRYPVYKGPINSPETSKLLYYIEDYLLLGFEGAGGQ